MKYIEHLEKNQNMKNVKLVAHYRTDSIPFSTLISACINMNPILVKADLSIYKEVQSMINDLKLKELYPTHIVFLPAPTFAYTRFSELNIQKAKAAMEIQVFSFLEILKAFLPNMEKNSYGKIAVMLSSCTIGEPPKYLSDYVISKYALLGLIKTIASEYGSSGININGISPDMVDTKFLNHIGRKVKEMSAEANPRHKNLNADDLIPTIDYLLSDENEFMNGCNLNLSGRAN